MYQAVMEFEDCHGLAVRRIDFIEYQINKVQEFRSKESRNFVKLLEQSHQLKKEHEKLKIESALINKDVLKGKYFMMRNSLLNFDNQVTELGKKIAKTKSQKQGETKINKQDVKGVQKKLDVKRAQNKPDLKGAQNKLDVKGAQNKLDALDVKIAKNKLVLKRAQNKVDVRGAQNEQDLKGIQNKQYLKGTQNKQEMKRPQYNSFK